jgi:putative ABC transport system permease protein
MALSFASLVIGIATITAVLVLRESLLDSFAREGRTLVGGDIAVERGTPVKPGDSLALDSLLAEPSVRTARVIDASVMIRTAASAAFSSVSAVSSGYPLYGQVVLEGREYRELLPDEIYAEQRLLDRLGVDLGGVVSIGQADFRIAGILVSEPDRATVPFGFGPRVLMSDQGFGRIGIDAQETRAEYELLIASENAIPEAVASQITSELRPTGARVALGSEGPDSVSDLVSQAAGFFVIAAALSLFLAAVNIQANLELVMPRLRRDAAVLTTLGMTGFRAASAVAALFLRIAVVAGISGSLIGVVFASFALAQAAPFISIDVSPELVVPIMFGLGFSVILMIASAIPGLMQILSVEPRTILTGRITERLGSSIARYVPAVMVLWAGLSIALGEIVTSTIATAAFSVLFSLMLLLAAYLLKLIYGIRKRLPLAWRMTASFTMHESKTTIFALASLAMSLSVLMTVAMTERSLVSAVSRVAVTSAPAAYVIDIQEDQLAGVTGAVPGIVTFPITRARLLRVNERDIQEERRGDLVREFNLTSRDALIAGENLTSGRWHGDQGANEVSVQESFADEADIQLGDTLVFSIQGFPRSVTVTSIRDVATANGLPFFYFVFSPDVLAGVPMSYFGYSNLEEEALSAAELAVSALYPNLSFIRTGEAVKVIERFAGAFSAAVQGIAVPSIVLATVLVITLVAISARSRARSYLVLTSFGANQSLTNRLLGSETFIYAAFAVTFSSFVSLGATYALLKYFLSINTIDIPVSVILWGAGIFGAAFIAAGVALRTLRSRSISELVKQTS